MSVCLPYSRAVVGQIKQQQQKTCPIMWTVVGRSRGVLKLAEKNDTNSGREEQVDVARIRPLMKILRQVMHAVFMHTPTIISSCIK
jgi:hypothetical protein